MMESKGSKGLAALRYTARRMGCRLCARREFLRFLAAGPLVTIAQEPTEKDALSVMDFETLQKTLPPAH
jgi:hypothetical protein